MCLNRSAIRYAFLKLRCCKSSVKFCYKLGKTCAETFKLLKKVYETMSSIQVYEWYGRDFKKDLMLVEEEPRPGRPSTSINDETEGQISGYYGVLREDMRRKRPAQKLATAS
ncbi:hypothetical protein ALC56_02538 [Trachymyrmex septentrionalis]|uniref:Mos1 transposase HTH domain-containing protein n=1 Tax=Trachymyrmex septentrionalis TaxID=34720 RepID=A0A195FQN5_9HYME|nr:hypothetical protein ALC56_02538 [Trachymyrmex septentrionalis]